MTLVQLQRRVACAIIAPPETPAEMQEEVEVFIKPNDRLTAVERLEIYQWSYWSRVLDSFREDFPGLRAVLGQRPFNRLAKTYLADVPSKSFTMRDLGSRLETWLSRHRNFAGTNPELAIDMVRLEWANIEAYDAAERKPLGPEDLFEIGPETKFGLQPHIRLLELNYPVDDLKIRAEDSLELRPKTVAPRPVFLAVHRRDFTVHYKRLAPDEFRILVKLHEGSSLGDALACISNENGVEGWFTTWSQLGWCCRPERYES